MIIISDKKNLTRTGFFRQAFRNYQLLLATMIHVIESDANNLAWLGQRR